MLTTEAKEKRQLQLEKVIHELSENLFKENEDRAFVIKLSEIYMGGFRHNYSGFFPLILEISKSEKTESLENLSNNLESIRSYLEKDFVSGEKEFEGMYDQANKLCDHINLEIGRWNYYSQNEQKIEDIKAQSTILSKEMREATGELKRASKQAASTQTDLISVLSIFAAIVIAFSGGFTFLGSVMTSINSATHYEAVLLCALICGMVIFNTIFLLMYLVSKITDKNIYAKCDTSDCSCEKRCNGIKKIRKRLPYVFYFNLLVLLGIAIDCVVWLIDIKGVI